MPDRTAVADAADVVYIYDGSFEGLLSCVFESYARKEIPSDIVPEEQYELSLYPTRFIETNHLHFERVKKGVADKIGKDALTAIWKGYLCSWEGKEIAILHFIRMGMRDGRRVIYDLANDYVGRLMKSNTTLWNEAHHYMGFVRFSVYENNAMVSVIEPKHKILPIIKDHFIDRYKNESFLIYDKTHRYALIYSKGRNIIIPADDYSPPQMSGEEQKLHDMWKLFYETIEIKERRNERCRMTMMPKRFWSQLHEMSGNKEANI
ncbi:MAG: TIGR03915 family putative DNA repair protein [Oscillospiraceae bacterium]|jgi:probable DNA metabolism protein|nr:TIGR03915 family putative DNA repair protein [Oscillospiraceae bacterium]